MIEISTSKLINARKRLVDDLRDGIREFWSSLDEDTLGEDLDSDEFLTALQVVYEVLGEEVGYVDGMACLSGVSKEDRENTMNTSVTAGLKRFLDDHEEICPGCEAAEELKVEVGLKKPPHEMN